MQKLLSIACVALVAAQLVAAQAPSAAQRSEKRILDCTLEATSQDDCDLNAYATRVITYAIPGILFAVLTLLFCPLYCVGKICCNSCGGRNQSVGCCIVDHETPMVYSRMDLYRVKFWMFVTLLLCCGAFVWGYVGGAELTDGLLEFGDAIVNVPNVLTVEINNIDNALILNKWDSATNGTVTERLFSTSGNTTKTEAESARDAMKKQIEDGLGNYQGTVDQAKEALWFAFLIPLCILAIGFVFAMCNCRKVLPMILVWTLFLFSILIWVCHGLFSAAFYIFSDVCVEIEGIATQKANVLASLAQCKDSQFSSFRTAFRSLEVSQAEATCTQLEGRCWVSTDSTAVNLVNGKVYDCPASLSCTGMTFATLVELLEKSFKIHNDIVTSNTQAAAENRCRDTSVSCTVKRCSWDCAVADSEGGYLLDIGLASAEIYIGFLGAKKVSNTIDTLGARFANCDSAMKIVLGGLSAPCNKMVSGLENEMNASGFLAFSMTCAIFVLAWGSKRFMNSDMAGVPIVEGEVCKETETAPEVAP